MTPETGRFEEPEPRIVVRDKRRIDPQSGEVREPEPDSVRGGAADSPAAPSAEGAEQVRELTETLQRLKAEYDNYRRRADRERQALAEVVTGNALAAFLPVLDDLERARAHGDLTGAFGSVGEALIAVTAKLGLERYATSGEEFDPQVHEAVMQAPPAQGSDVPVLAEVFRPGYRHAGRVLRAAQVSVSQPAGDVPAADQPPDEGTVPSA